LSQRFLQIITYCQTSSNKMPDALQQLLAWSTEQSAANAAGSSTSTAVTAKPDASPETSTATAAVPVPQQKLDTAILDHIMGKSEAVMMREKLAIAVDQEQDLSERIMAMDDFEMVRASDGFVKL
jgi:hypothetical protein